MYRRMIKQAGRRRMKRIIVTALVLTMGVLIMNPATGYTQPSYYNRGYEMRGPSGNYGHYNPQPVWYERSRNDNSGLLIGAAAIGAIVLGAVLVSSLSQPREAARQEVVYAAPSSGSPVYGQPSAYNSAPPGQWVTVQGQWVNGTWIPAHNVWVPVNP
jgi:hypothetical protein